MAAISNTPSSYNGSVCLLEEDLDLDFFFAKGSFGFFFLDFFFSSRAAKNASMSSSPAIVWEVSRGGVWGGHSERYTATTPHSV